MICTICKKDKSENEYYKRNDGYKFRRCKKCCAKSDKLKYKNEREKQGKTYRSMGEIKQAKEQGNLHFKQNEFIKEKDLYLDKIIKYDASPTGFAYIGLAKQPLMKNDNGIGYKGVKVQSENRELIQCNECGKWVQTINNQHLKLHNLGLSEYKKKFGYFDTTALISDKLSNLFTSNIIHNQKMNGKHRPPIKHVVSKKKDIRNNGVKRIEYQNLKGTCQEQLISRVINYLKRFKRLPNGSSRDGDTGQRIFAIIPYRYGSMNNFFKMIGLPTRYKMGQITQFNFPDGIVRSSYHGNGYQEIYEIMKNKCKLLQN